MGPNTMFGVQMPHTDCKVQTYVDFIKVAVDTHKLPLVVCIQPQIGDLHL